MILIIVLIALVLVCYMKFTANKEFIKENCKTKEDVANAKNARKIYSKTKTVIVLLILSIVSLLVVMLLNFTNIEYAIKDYISTDFINDYEKTFSYYFYLIPLYILVSRQIIIEVNLSDFLHKYFKIEEPESENQFIKQLLFKPKAAKTEEKLDLDQLIAQAELKLKERETEILDFPEEPTIPKEVKKEEPKKEEPKKEERKEETKEEKPETKTELDLPQMKKEEK